MPMVTVGCKLPHGLVMELIGKGNLGQPAPRSGPRVKLNGANSLPRYGFNPGQHKFAVTMVDGDFAAAWFKANKDLQFVKDGLVFMADKADTIDGHVKDFTAAKTGLEPLDSSKPPKIEGIQVEADPEQWKKEKVAA